MWRSAHGRLGAIVVLAGGLSTCATTPKPVAPPTDVGTEEPSYEPGCGTSESNTPPEPTPEERRAEAVRAIEEAVRLRCAWGEKSVHRYGEIRLQLGRGTGIEPSVASKRSGGLTADDRRCVEEAARGVIHRTDLLLADFADDPEIYVALGTAPPLLPPADKLAARWLGAMRSRPARARFAAQLPPDVRLEDNDCLSIPRRSHDRRGLTVIARRCISRTRARPR